MESLWGIIYLVTQLPCNYLSLLDFLTARLLALFLAKIASAMESRLPGIGGMILGFLPMFFMRSF